MTHPLGSVDISVFSPEINKILFIKHGWNFDDVSKIGCSRPS